MKTNSSDIKVLLSPEKLAKRVSEIAHQINEDYDGKRLHVVCVLENGFIFTADLVRALDMPVVCHFIKPQMRPTAEGRTIEIFFSPEVDVKGEHVLLVEALVESGITSEFLTRNLNGRGAASVKLVTLLDRQSARRVQLQPDYFGFLIDESFVVGYGLGASNEEGRNLPYVGATQGKSALVSGK